MAQPAEFLGYAVTTGSACHGIDLAGGAGGPGAADLHRLVDDVLGPQGRRTARGPGPRSRCSQMKLVAGRAEEAARTLAQALPDRRADAVAVGELDAA